MPKRTMADAVVLVVIASLVVWSAIAVAGVLHELGHAAAARAAGAELRGIVVEWTVGGATYVDHPYVEHPEAAPVLHAGGLLVHLPLGMLALALSTTPLGRRVLFVPALAVVCLGGSAMVLAHHGLTGDPSPALDIVRLADAAGWSRPFLRGTAAAVGITASLVVGGWYAFAVLRWGCRAWPCGRAEERRLVLLAAGWGPVVLYLLSRGVLHLATGSPPGERLAALAVLVGACLVAAWLVADVAAAPPRPCRDTTAVRLRSVTGAALLALAAAVLVGWVNTRFDPARIPDAEALAAIARRHPASERHLRLAGYWSLRARRVDDARAYYARALEAAPDSAGAMHDLAVALHASGRPEDAVDLLLRARDAGPGIAGIAAKTAQVEEQLGRLDAAARSWRVYADLVEAGAADPDSRRRHARMARGRARSLEDAADARRLADPGR